MNNNKEVIVSTTANTATTKRNAGNFEERDTTQPDRATQTQIKERCRNPNATPAGKHIKLKNCWDGANAANDPRKKRR